MSWCRPSFLHACMRANGLHVQIHLSCSLQPFFIFVCFACSGTMEPEEGVWLELELGVVVNHQEGAGD